MALGKAGMGTSFTRFLAQKLDARSHEECRLHGWFPQFHPFFLGGDWRTTIFNMVAKCGQIIVDLVDGFKMRSRLVWFNYLRLGQADRTSHSEGWLGR